MKFEVRLWSSCCCVSHVSVSSQTLAGPCNVSEELLRVRLTHAPRWRKKKTLCKTTDDSWLSLEVQVWKTALDLSRPILSITKHQITKKKV